MSVERANYAIATSGIVNSGQLRLDGFGRLLALGPGGAGGELGAGPAAWLSLRSASACVKMYTVVYFVEPPHRSANPAQSPVDTLNRIP